MNKRNEKILAVAAVALAACSLTGCRSYPHTMRSSSYVTYPTSSTTYVSPASYAPTYVAEPGVSTTTYITEPVAVGTSTTYVESYYNDPYYYGPGYYGPTYYDRGVPPPRHHHHDRGPEHGYGRGPVMPPRGAGPARGPSPHASAGAAAQRAAEIQRNAAAHKVEAARQGAAMQANAARNAAAIQANAARNASAARNAAVDRPKEGECMSLRRCRVRLPGFWMGFLDFFTAGLFFLVLMPLGLQAEIYQKAIENLLA